MYSILDIIDSRVKADEICFPAATVEESCFPVTLRRLAQQVFIVSFPSSRKQGDSVSPVSSRFYIRDGV